MKDKVFKSQYLFYGWLLIIVAASILFFQNFFLQKNINSDISSILPIEQREAAELNQVFNQLAAKNVVWLIKSKNKSNLQLMVSVLEERLINSNVVTIKKAEQDSLAKLYQLMTTNPAAFLSAHDRQLLANKAHKKATLSRIEYLFSPLSTVDSNRLEQDPLLFAENSIKGFSSKSGSNFQYQSYLGYEQDNWNYLLINLELNGSPFDLGLQQSYLSQLESIEAEAAGLDSEILQLGVIGFAASETQQGLFEAKFIGLGSLIAIFCLVALIFRSAAPLIVISFIIGLSLLVALAMASLIFGELHILSILVGSSLIGISVDYVFHYFAKNTLYSPAETINKIIKPVTLGLFTSVLGYLALYFSDLLVLKQIAAISTIGLTAAFLSTVLILPRVKLDFSKKDSYKFSFFGWLNSIINKRSYKYSALFISIVILLAGAYFSSTVKFNDQLELLHASPANLIAQQKEVEEVVTESRPGYNLVIKANSLEALLQQSEHLESLLDAEITTGNISGYFAPHQFMASQKRQTSNKENILEWFESNEVDEYLSLIDKLAQKEALLNQIQTAGLLSKEQLENTPVGNYLNQLIVTNEEGGYYGLVKLNNLVDKAPLLKLVDNNEQLFSLDTKTSFSEFLSKVRSTSIELVIYAYIAILFILLVVYGFARGWKLFLPPLAAAVFSLLFAVSIGQQLNVFHVVALTLVLGIGIDYTIFYTSSTEAEKSDMVMAVSCSMLSTVLAFGLMSFSQTPAVAGFGTIVLSGIIMAYLLAPLAKGDSE